ncbi:MAG: CPBP family glutamic-type intramembrane protease [Chloroflexi bacterium]|nr:CPBP family glutamic-type intramembrane protease [Chloroflexota bacterium]
MLPENKEPVNDGTGQKRSAVKKDKLLPFIIAAGIICLILFIAIYPYSFPASGVDLKINRLQAQYEAAGFLEERGWNLKNKIISTIFASDDEGIAFLEQKTGVGSSGKWANKEIPLWFWQSRWISPPSIEEFLVQIDPSGKLVAFSHTIPEDEKGKSLDAAGARKLAEEFLTGYIKLNMADYELVEQSSQKKSFRTDHTLAWKKKHLNLDGGELRIEVTIHGDRIDGFDRYLKVPEKFISEQGRENQKGNQLVYFGAFLSFMILLVVFVVFIFAMKKHMLIWRYTLPAAVVLGAVTALSGLNGLPLAISQLGTTNTIPVQMIGMILGILFEAVLSGLFIILVASSGDVLYKDSFPRHVPLMKNFTLKGFLSREYTTATVVGYSLACFHLAYVSIFYWVGGKYFGVWSPPEMPYDNGFSTALPWIYPLLIGLYAALTEEFLYRFFSISFLRKYLKNIWLAILIPSIIWAMMHCNYPQKPFYIRGVELLPVAIIMGWVFVRYGIFATLISHYTVNATLGSFLMLTSTNIYFKISGLIVVALALAPLIFAWAVHAFRKDPGDAGQEALMPEPYPAREKFRLFEDVPGDLPEKETAEIEEHGGESIEAFSEEIETFPETEIPGRHGFPDKLMLDGRPPFIDDKAYAGSRSGKISMPPLPKGESHYEPLKKNSIIFLIVLTVLSIILLIAISEDKPGKKEAGVFPGLTVTRLQADKSAREFLNGIGFKTDGWKSVAYFYSDLDGQASRYLVEKAGFDKYNSLASKDLNLAGWEVWFYKPLEKEEFSVTIDPEGKPAAFYHRQKEDTPGASLGKEKAFKKALEDMKKVFKIKPGEYELIENRQEKLKKRTDYFYTWELKKDKVGDSSFRVAYSLQGDKPGAFNKFLKIPEEWMRLQDRKTALKTTSIIISSIFFICFIAWSLIQFVLRFVNNKIRWKFPFYISTTMTALFILNMVNDLPLYMKGYPAAEETIGQYDFNQAVGKLMVIIIYFLMTFIAAALAESVFRELFPRTSGPLMFLKPSSWRREEMRDALILLFTVPVILAAVFKLLDLIQRTFFADTMRPGGMMFFSPDNLFPALGVVIKGIQMAVMGSLFLVIFVGFLRMVIKSRAFITVFIWLLAVFAVGGVSVTLREFLVNAAEASVIILLVVWLIWRFVRFNRIFYVGVMLLSFLLAAGFDLSEYPGEFFIANGYILLAIGFMLLAGLFVSLRFLPGTYMKEPAPIDYGPSNREDESGI